MLQAIAEQPSYAFRSSSAEDDQAQPVLRLTNKCPEVLDNGSVCNGPLQRLAGRSPCSNTICAKCRNVSCNIESADELLAMFQQTKKAVGTLQRWQAIKHRQFLHTSRWVLLG